MEGVTTIICQKHATSPSPQAPRNEESQKNVLRNFLSTNLLTTLNNIIYEKENGCKAH